MIIGKRKLFAALLFSIILAACGGDSGLSELGDYELAERQAACIDRAPTAPGSVQACKNIQRECDRRKKELGLYLCRAH